MRWVWLAAAGVVGVGTLVFPLVAAPTAAAPPTAATVATPGTASPVCRSVSLAVLVLGAPSAVVVAPAVLVLVGVGVVVEGLLLPARLSD